jgi:hypothetical protein
VPKPFPKIDCPKVTLWSNADFHNFIKTKNQKAGETDRNSSTSGSGGRCCKKQGHPYLQNKDSSLVTGDALGTLSSEVRVVWLSLNGRGMAPTMFSKMSSEALEFLWRSVLPVPELEFLLYCDDGHWKLKEWCKQNYSSWARNHGIRLPAKTESIDDVLNNTKLLHMDTPASHEGEVSADEMEEDSNEKDDSEDSDSDDDDPPPATTSLIFLRIPPLPNADIYTGAISEHILQICHKESLVSSLSHSV